MLVPHCSQNKDIQVIWAKFMDIIGDLKLDFTSEEGILELQRNIKSWFEHFLKVYQAKDVTPYMHALCYHVPEFLSLYQNIAYYTQQGLEKYNNRASKDFFRSTIHKGVDALKQTNTMLLCRPTDDQLSADCRPTVDRQSADRFFGELFFTITGLLRPSQYLIVPGIT